MYKQKCESHNLKLHQPLVYSYSRYSYIWVNSVQITILNFLVELSLTPAETMPMTVKTNGHHILLLYGTYSKCFTYKTTQEWKGLHQCSTQFKNVFFDFLHIIFFVYCKKQMHCHKNYCYTETEQQDKPKESCTFCLHFVSLIMSHFWETIAS
jgi:hypothetical protein